MSVLLVVAHPDDEVLGCGGTAHWLVSRGLTVHSCILSGNADARQHRPTDPDLLADTLHAQEILGLASPFLGSFPNIQLNTVPHLHLVQFIERAIEETSARIVFTHHPADLNDDHLQVSRACQAAVRLFQRKVSIPTLEALYFMEVPSATDWALSAGPTRFQQDTYVDIGKDGLRVKLDALRAYRGVIRPSPHSRSEELIRALATCRGAQAGLALAESFQTAIRVVRTHEEFL